MRERLLPEKPVLLFMALVGFGSTAACGGSTTPEADAPKTEDTSEPEKDDETDDTAAAPKEEEPEEPKEEAPKETPKTILVREGTLFMLDHKKSDMGVKIEEDCKKKSKDDVAKQANCVSKAMGKLVREGISFDEDDDGKWWYIRFGVEKNVQVVYNRVEIEVGEPQGKNITLKPVGKDTAKRKKGTVPKELTFEVPDEYTIVLVDPDCGRLEFEPKLGLLEEGQPQQ